MAMLLNTQNQLQNNLLKQIEQINFQGIEEQEQHYLTILYEKSSKAKIIYVCMYVCYLLP